MIKEQMAVYEVLKDIIGGKTGHLSKAAFFPQKPEYPFAEKIKQPFKRCTPESQGISSVMMADFVRDLTDLKGTDIHGITILRNGRIIGEFSFAPYRNDIWHVGHSLCKSVTGMAIGLLIQEGKLHLEDKVLKIFEKKTGLFSGIKKKNLTVAHLLTMTSGVAFNETGVVSSDDWVKSFLDFNVTENPGTKYEYNSMNSYMLSAIVTELTGETLMEYLRPRLFEPMGITKVFWETCPKGITKGGWGLFLCQEDTAKLGQLYLQKGNWQGTQLISSDWIEQSVTKRMDTPVKMCEYGYGYQIWLGGREGAYTFNGMLGQNVLVYPDLNMVFVTNAGSNELFPKCQLLDVIKKYFEGDFTPQDELAEDPIAYQRLLELQKRLKVSRASFPETISGGWKQKNFRRKLRKPGTNAAMRMLDGKIYRLERQQAGLFPLIMQVLHNNFTDGIGKLGFMCESGKSYFLIWEGVDCLKLEIGFEKAAINTVKIHGEPYLAAVKGQVTKDEEGRRVLKIDIAYLEEAVRRKIKFIFEKDQIMVQFDETPGKNLIHMALEEILKEVTNHLVLNYVNELMPINLPEIMIEQAICPQIPGILEK